MKRKQCNAIILPRQVLRDSRQKTLRRRVLGVGEDSGSSASGDCSDESEDSSANEYAEGLGCADTRRCKESASSGFTFDEHPREEYFEQPRSATEERVGGGLELPGKGSRVASGLRQSVIASLAGLENLEETRERTQVRRREMSARGQAARQTSRCQHEAAASLPVAQSEKPCNAALGHDPCKKRKGAELAELRAHCACLGIMRSRLEARAGTGAKLRPHPAELEEDAQAALQVLRALDLVTLGVAELRATGLGRELSRAAWQQHAFADVAVLSASLITRWRSAVRGAEGKAGSAGG